MTQLAIQNLLQQKFRLGLSVVGVSLAIMLILLLNGFLAGIYLQVTAYLDHTPADLVVAQDGIRNLLSATSILPPGVDDDVRATRGVEKVTAIISQFTILDIHEEKVVVYLVGFDPQEGGGPWQLVEGRSPQQDDEVVLDSVMAEEHGFSVGDSIPILDDTFRVVGLSGGTNSWMASFIFITRQAAENLFMMPDSASFLLVTGEEPDTLLSDLENRLPSVEITPAGEMKQNDLDLLVEIFAVPLRLMVAISFTVGTAILGMVIYTLTMEKEREFGVLKAVGATNQHLYWLVSLQGLTTAVLGVLLGHGVARLAAGWIMGASPKFLIVFEQQADLLVSLTGLLMGLGAALAPAKKVGQLDPAQVFRS